ncbi:MAG: Zn-ribbon domain-containing OB-fold protein [Proteobacteria bacterium]|nr:Zn-ribbon domain-containing OB-fold protein [Pseudomonadota bacterium]
MTEYKKPLPLITSLSKVFYDGCKEGKLMYQQCQDCGKVVFFPKELCDGCLSENLEWKTSSGKGSLFTFTVTYDYAPPEFADDVPFALAIVNLEEGFSIMSNMVECDFEKLECDMPVQVVFDPVTPEITLPKFKPTKLKPNTWSKKWEPSIQSLNR